MSATNRPEKTSGRRRTFDVIVVGGGPAGAVSAWALATRGVRVLILDRARFPREKVCGDFVEPRGLRLFSKMGCLSRLEATGPLAITHVNLFLDGTSAYRERIPFYASHPDLPPYGYIIPREELDERILSSAIEAGAGLREGCQVLGVERAGNTMVLRVREGGRDETLRAPIVIGADGTRSIVARSLDEYSDDPRYMAVSQRAYVEGVDTTLGEAAFVFDRDFFPGYGWMFPMSDGRANVGVGILAEVRDRYQISVPKLFDSFFSKLRRLHGGCGEMELASKPIGGIVKTYGGRGRNYFDGGILVGDAGCFVDPMTGEGITPAAESALIGSAVVADALNQGRTDAAFLSTYERDFRAHFDPGMCYLDYAACLMRNRHLREFWLSVVKRGCQIAMRDRDFAKLGGAPFGGLEVRPLDIVMQMWVRTAGQLLEDSGRYATELFSGNTASLTAAMADMGRWQIAWWASVAEDPGWHARWMKDVTAKWLRLFKTTRLGDPRTKPPVQLRLGHSANSV